MKIIRKFFFLQLLLIIVVNINAQQALLYNQSDIYILQGENVYVHGGFLNSGNGQVINEGTVHVDGDWTNNASNQVFPTAIGTVRLSGADQTIGGTSPTGFGDLVLAGTGIKSLNINTEIAGTLALNDRELATQSNTLTILSSNVNTITRTTGFVSTSPTGALIRNTSGSGTWLFPVGSSNPVLGYRPVEIEPIGSGTATFQVTLANQNPTIAGYDINQHLAPVCLVNHKYYHKAKLNSGNGNVNLKYYYDNMADGAFTIPAAWNGTQWAPISNSNHTANSSPNLSSFSLNNFTLLNPSIIAFADSAPANGTPIIYEQNNILYAAQGNTFQWYLNGNMIQGATQSSYTPTTQGNYTVYVTLAGNCAFMSAEYYFYFVGIENTKNETNISIYPNPCTSYIILDFNQFVEGEVNYQIFNTAGKLIKDGFISDISNNRKYELNTENLNSGIYFIKIFNKNLHFTKKLIIFAK